MRGICATPDDLRPPGTVTVHHSGDLGDIVYSMQFASTLGKGRFLEVVLGPDPRWQTRELMTPSKFEWFAPLLRRQPFVREVAYASEPPPVDWALNDFRRTWFDPKNAHRVDRQLAAWYFEHFSRGVPPQGPWLVADPSPDSKKPVVINRTARWRSPNFPWAEICKRYAGRMVFVGAKTECDVFNQEFKADAEYRSATDCLDLANIIAGAQLFIGNQSLPMALALAVGVTLIQESCPGQHDCVFPGRNNAQFSVNGTPLMFPNIKPMRRVSNYPNRQGVIELGPFEGAPGIGDTLMVTPLARALGSKAVMCLPPDMERFMFMFRGLCPVRVQENPPTFKFQPGLQSESLLRMFGQVGVDPLPRIDVPPEALHCAKRALIGMPNAVAFTPTCARHWVNMRQRPTRFWEPVIAKLKERYTVLQFGLPDYPLLDGAKRMPFVSVEDLASLFAVIGRYVGTHTGDYHLMVAVGGKVAVADPDPWPEAVHWTYNAPSRIAYGKLSHPKTVLEAMEKVGI